MKYTIAKARMLNELEEKVNALMEEFWEPHGSLVTGGEWWVQPMTRMNVYEVDLRRKVADEATIYSDN